MKSNTGTWKIVALLATTALACGITGVGAGMANPLASLLTTTVLGGISVNVASGYIDRLKYGKLREWFIKPHPDNLNHDLQKALLQTVLSGVDNVAILYSSMLGEAEQKRFYKLIGQFKDAIEKDFPVGQSDAVTKTELDKLLYLDADSATEELLLKIPTAFEELDLLNKEVPFSKFFNENILAQFQLSFGEILKDEEHVRVWVAFQRFLLEDIKDKVETILAKQDTLHKDIRELKERQTGLPQLDKEALDKLALLAEKLNNPVTLQAELDNALDSFIKGVKTDIALLLEKQAEQYQLQADHFALSKKHYDITAQVNQRVSVLGEKLDRKFTRKQVVFTSSAIVVLGLIISGLMYNIISRPFDAVLVLNPMKVQDDYPPLSNKAQLKLYTTNKQSEPVSADYKATFLDISSDFEGQQVRIELEDELWQAASDTISLAKGVNNITIVPNDKWAELKGVVKMNYSTLIEEPAELRLNNDTIIYTTEKGDFSIILPLHQRRRQHSFDLYYKGRFIKKDRIYPEGSKPIYIDN